MTLGPRLARIAGLLTAAALVGFACHGRPRALASASSAPSPVYESGAAGARIHWRFVPIDDRAGPHPTQADFELALDRCAPSGSLDERAVVCMSERGFYRSQCSNGVDDDGDGEVDFGNDPGCAEEHGVTESPQCDNGVDDDGDGLVDWDGGGVAHPDPDCEGNGANPREAARPARSWLDPL